MRTFLMTLLAMVILGAATPSYNSSVAFAQARRKVTSKAVKYACPMHPELILSSPGKCRKCGMTLKAVANETKQLPKTAASDESESTSNEPAALSVRIPDVAVYDQDGTRLKFYSDLVKGKTVAINFIFTTCTTICPPLTATFRRVQQQLDPVRNDVSLISISVDPTTDTPERLKDFAAKFKPSPGWTFITGDQAEIRTLLRALGAAVENKNDHSPSVLVGNESADYWVRTYGLAPPTALVKLITDAADRDSKKK